MIKTKLCRKFLLLLTIICFVNFVYSQKKYNYNEYFLPELNINGLVFYGYGGYSDSNESRRADADSEVNYFKFENSALTQRYVETDLFLNYERENSMFGNLNINREIISGNINYYQELRNFLKPNDKKSFFWEIAQAFSMNFSNTYDYLINNNVSKSVYSRMEFPVRFGKGRIESLEGLATAEFLIDDLIDEGLSDSLLSQEKLFELAQKLVTLQNERVFDTRRARIYRLTEASKWLEENGIISDIKSFTILNDNLHYNIVGTRWEGSAHSVGLFPVLYPVELLADLNNSFGFGLSYNWEKFKNISKNWYYRASVSTSFNHVRLPEEVNYITNIFSVSTKYQINYVPNTRTIVRVNPELVGIYIDKNQRYWSAGLDINFNWFINYRLFLTGGFKLDFRNLISDKSNIVVTSFGTLYRNEFDFYYPSYQSGPTSFSGLTDNDGGFFYINFNYNVF